MMFMTAYDYSTTELSSLLFQSVFFNENVVLGRVIASPTCIGVRRRDYIKLESDLDEGDILLTATTTTSVASDLIF
jgi:hypothetical protein